MQFFSPLSTQFLFLKPRCLHQYYSRITSVHNPIPLKSITILYSNCRQHYSSDSFSGDEAGVGVEVGGGGGFLFKTKMTFIDWATY